MTSWTIALSSVDGQLDWKEQYERALDGFSKNGFFVLFDGRQIEALDEEIVIGAGAEVRFLCMEREVAQLKRELKNLVVLGAAGGEEIPELVTAMRERQDRIRRLETDLALARRTPELVAEATAKMKAAIKARLEGIREALAADPTGSRDVYKLLFPEGLTFTPSEADGRQVFEITGTAKVQEIVTCVVTPPGTSQ